MTKKVKDEQTNNITHDTSQKTKDYAKRTTPKTGVKDISVSEIASDMYTST